MGCACSKGVKDEYKIKEPNWSKKIFKRLVSSQGKIAVEADNANNEATTSLISRDHVEKDAGFNAALGKAEAKKLIVFERRALPQLQRWATMELGLQGERLPMCRVLSVRDGIDGAHIVAGWPYWLTAVAGDAIRGWIPRKLESFQKLDKIGQGTYSNVYRAHDLETGKMVALKKVKFCITDPESVHFMAREILILRRMDHPNVMKLDGVITSRVSSSLYLVFEYMEHDLAGLAASPMVKFTESQIKCYMQQLLRGLEHFHSRGVLHRDIKGSNILIDNNGNLKIGDFGLATFVCADQKRPLTSHVVTLWYRPPELLLGSTDYGVGVDLWSTGCILAELFVGKPLMPGRTEVEQLHKIFKLCGSPSEEYWTKSKLPLLTIFKPQYPYERHVSEALKDLPPSALSLVESLLSLKPECRGPATSALQSEFFLTEPLPCNPLSLPKYPPSKQLDTKLRNEEVRRQRIAAKEGELESSGNESKESKAVPALDANAELQASILKWKGQSNSKSNGGQYQPEEETGSSFPGGSMQIGGASGNSLAILDEEPNYDSPKAIDYNIQRSQKGGAIDSSQPDFSIENSADSSTLEKCLNTTHELLNDADSAPHIAGRHDCSYNNNAQVYGNGIIMGNALKKTTMPYFGPLLGGSMERMIKEHEKHIQTAVRKARIDKNKTRKCYSDYGQTNPLLEYISQE